MTIREFMTAVSSANVTADLQDFAKDYLSKLDATNAKRAKATSAKKAAENQPLFDKLNEVLTERGTLIASEAGELLDVSTSKASYLLRKLAEDGVVTVADLKIKGKGTVKQYTLVDGE